jgi:hypothetical protein
MQVSRETANDMIATELQKLLETAKLQSTTTSFIVVKASQILVSVAKGAYCKPLLKMNDKDRVVRYLYNVYLKIIGLGAEVSGVRQIGSPMTREKAIVISFADLQSIYGE